MLENENDSSGYSLIEPNLHILEEKKISNYSKVDNKVMFTTPKNDALYVEAKSHDKINTEDTPANDQKEDDEPKWKDCIQKKDVKAARKMLEDGNFPSPEELQFAVKDFTYSNETREIVKDICQRIEILLMEEHEEIEYIKGCFKHDDPNKNVIFVIKTSKPITITSLYQFYVVEENNENEMKDMKLEDSTEYQLEERFQKACECLRKISPDFMEVHSNLTSTSVSLVKLRKMQTPEKAVCIVFYVEDKGFIPIGEDVLPKQIEYGDNMIFETDVREGECATANAGPCDKHKDLKIGCRIESTTTLDGGTLGGFINHPTNGLCAISCAHVLLTVKDFDEIYHGKKSIESLGTIQCFQPKKPDLCGEICDMKLFGKNKNNCGMDIALFKVDEERKPKTNAFPDVLAVDVHGNRTSLINELLSQKLRYNPRAVIQDFGQMKMMKMMKGISQVVKYGMKTKLTSGKYHCSGSAVKLQMHGKISSTDIKTRVFRYSLADQIEISDDCGKFSEAGDSGAMVFVTDSNKDLMALGIVIGRNEKIKVTYVTPIWNILEEIEMPLPYVLAEPSSAHEIIEELKRSALTITNKCEALTGILEQ